MGNIDKLIKEVEDYRDATTEINWKQYLEFVKVRQDESEDLDLPDVLSQVCHGGDKKCDSVEDYEQETLANNLFGISQNNLKYF